MQTYAFVKKKIHKKFWMIMSNRVPNQCADEHKENVSSKQQFILAATFYLNFLLSITQAVELIPC